MWRRPRRRAALRLAAAKAIRCNSRPSRRNEGCCRKPGLRRGRNSCPARRYAAIATRPVRYSARDLLPQCRLLESFAHRHARGGPPRRRAQGKTLGDRSGALPQQQFERARGAAARLINAETDDVALISSVSYGVATAAKLITVPAGSRVLVLENDHSSAVLEWMTRAPAKRFSVDVVRRPDDGDWTAAVLAAIERPGAAPIGLASISSVHWADGGTIDIDRVAAALRPQRAMLLVDATHAAGVMKIDVRTLDPDFLVFPTYKWLLGPYGRAFLYIAKRRQD